MNNYLLRQSHKDSTKKEPFKSKTSIMTIQNILSTDTQHSQPGNTLLLKTAKINNQLNIIRILYEISQDSSIHYIKVEMADQVRCEVHNELVSSICITETCLQQSKLFCDECYHLHRHCEIVSQWDFYQQIDFLKHSAYEMFSQNTAICKFLTSSPDLPKNSQLQQCYNIIAQEFEYLNNYERILRKYNYNRDCWLEGVKFVKEANLKLQQYKIYYNILLDIVPQVHTPENWTSIPIDRTIKSDNLLSCCCSSRDSKFIACGQQNGDITIWDIRTFMKIIILVGHTAELRTLSYSYNDKFIVSGGEDGTIRIWDTEKASQVGEAINAHQNHVIINVGFSPICDEFYSQAYDHRLILWQNVYNPRIIKIIVETWVNYVEYSLNGRYFITVSSAIKLFNNKGDLRRQLPSNKPQHVTISKDSNKVFHSHGDGIMSVYSIKPMKLMFNFITGIEQGAFALSPDQLSIAIYFDSFLTHQTKKESSQTQNFMRIYNILSKNFITFAVQEHSRQIKFTNDNKFIICCCLNDLMIYQDSSQQLMIQ